MSTVLQNSRQSWTIVFKDSKKVHCREISKSPAIGCFYLSSLKHSPNAGTPIHLSTSSSTKQKLLWNFWKRNFETVWKMGLKVVFFSLLHLMLICICLQRNSCVILKFCLCVTSRWGCCFIGDSTMPNFCLGCWRSNSGPHTCGKYVSHWAASSALGSHILKDCFL